MTIEQAPGVTLRYALSAALLLTAGVWSSSRLGRARQSLEPRSRTTVGVIAAVGRASISDWSSDSVLAWADTLIARQPFTLAPVPTAPALSSPPAPRRPAIALALLGVIGGGRDRAALIGGIPGQSGTVILQPGDTLGGVRLRRVDEGTATVVVSDSTIRLVLRVPTP